MNEPIPRNKNNLLYVNRNVVENIPNKAKKPIIKGAQHQPITPTNPNRTDMLPKIAKIFPLIFLRVLFSCMISYF